MILLRATRPDPHLSAFQTVLAQASGMAVVAVLDERRAPAALPPDAKIGMTDALCADLGLHRPADYAWRCGDYGYYAARARFPREPLFWMIEYDVRIRRAADFFAKVADDPTDFLAVDVRPADEHWFWYDYQSARDAPAWRCLFGITRLSARAIDLLWETRRRQARHLSRRWRWPNDEGFVATTLAAAGLSLADFNARIPDAWTADSFNFETPVRGEDLQLDTPGPRLLHPVLFGEAYARKLAALKTRREITVGDRVVRKSLKLMNRRLNWLG